MTPAPTASAKRADLHVMPFNLRFAAFVATARANSAQLMLQRQATFYPALDVTATGDFNEADPPHARRHHARGVDQHVLAQRPVPERPPPVQAKLSF